MSTDTRPRSLEEIEKYFTARLDLIERCASSLDSAGGAEYEELQTDITESRSVLLALLREAAQGVEAGEERLEWREVCAGTWEAKGEPRWDDCWSVFIQQGDESHKWIGFLKITGPHGVATVSIEPAEILADAQAFAARRLSSLRRALGKEGG